MKVFQIYNEQRSAFGGEPAVVEATMRVLAENGHQARLIMKSSRCLERSVFRRACAFWGGIYNVRAYREMRRLLEEDRPDVVHVHSVYPMFSPSIMAACRRARVPVVMTIHSNILTCPTWYHVYKGRTCEECVGGREYRCILKNCRENIPESVAYALRSAVARRFRLFQENVDVFLAPTPFAKSKLVQAGFDGERIAVVPNPAAIGNLDCEPAAGEYVAFAGRISAEKGIGVLLAAAARLPEIPFQVAGDGPILTEMTRRATPNVKFVGRLPLDRLVEFYRSSRVVAVPSITYETFNVVAAEAMALGLPVVASRIGGLPYVVEDGQTGLLFEPGNAADMAAQLRRLWDNPELRRGMGAAGRRKAMLQYTPEAYYRNLMTAYEMARMRSNRGSGYCSAGSQNTQPEPVFEAGENQGARSLVGAGHQRATPSTKLPRTTTRQFKTIRFLGLDLHCISYRDMFALIDMWIGAPDRQGRSVALINVNCCVSGLLDRRVRSIYQHADLLGIDSMPFLRIARLFKNQQSDRLYAPDMMLEAARQAPNRGYKFFFYGGVPGAAEAMSAKLRELSPELQVAGVFSPPFRELTPEEDDGICRRIAASGANIVWVGLGSPKQDIWIAQHRQKLPGCVLIAAGATFDFFSGRIRQAPPWIRAAGLEWVYRLFQDPARLWKRYTLYNILFGAALPLELLGILRLGGAPSAPGNEPRRDADSSEELGKPTMAAAAEAGRDR